VRLVLPIALLFVGIFLGAAGAVSLQSSPAANDSSGFGTATVTRVIDGDTVELESGERVRYLGLDTPEMRPTPECGAVEATEFNRQLVEGRSVELLPGPEDRDQFGRLLRYVFSDGTFINAELIRAGMGHPQSFLPEERFRQLLTQMANDARLAGRGLWSTCDWN